jgi:hypothetical protein
LQIKLNKLNRNSTLVLLQDISQEYLTESTECRHEFAQNQDDKIDQTYNMMNIEFEEHEQEDNIFSLADTTESSNYTTSEDEDEFLEDITGNRSSEACPNSNNQVSSTVNSYLTESS